MLAGVAFAELVLNRILARLIQFDGMGERPRALRLLDDVGLFAFELVSVLAVLTFAFGLLRLTFGTRHRPGVRVSFALVGGVFVLLAAAGVVLKLPPQAVIHLHTSFAFLALLVVLLTYTLPVGLRVKLGTSAVALPIELHLLAEVMRRVGAASASAWPLEPWSLAQTALLVAGIVAAPCFVPRRARLLLPAIVATVVTVAAAVVVRIDWNSAARVAAFAAGIEWPFVSWLALLYLLGLGLFTFTVLALLLRPGVDRLRGYGLLLLGLGGFALELPYQIALAAVGMLCLADAALRLEREAVSRQDFERLVRAGAGAVGAPQATVTGRAGYEVARAYAPATAAAPVALRLERRAARLSSIEVVVGDTPPRDPPLTVTRRGMSSLGPDAGGPPLATDDSGFDKAFDVRDRRGVAARLLDDPTRAKMAALLSGWLGVWPQRGVCYRSSTLPDGEAGLSSLVQFLIELAGRAA